MTQWRDGWKQGRMGKGGNAVAVEKPLEAPSEKEWRDGWGREGGMKAGIGSRPV